MRVRKIIAHVFLGLVVTACSDLFAGQIVLDAQHTGYYVVSNIGSQQFVNSYLTGSQSNGIINADRNSYFVFDLAGVTDTIVDARLELYSPEPNAVNANTGGYHSDDPSETFELHEVVTSVDDIISPGDIAAIFADLGDGTVLGSVTMTSADEPAGGKTIEIAFNASATTVLNATSGLVALGGSLQNAELAAAGVQQLFAGTLLPITPPPQLVLTTVPEPSSIVSFVAAAIVFVLPGFRARQRSYKS